MSYELTTEALVLSEALESLLAAAEAQDDISDDDAERLYALAYKALLTNDFAAADQLLSFLQLFKPAEPRFMAAHAHALRGLGRSDQALGMRTLALMADGGNPSHLFGLGEDLIAADDRAAARDVFQLCVDAATDPEFDRLRERAQAMVALLEHHAH
jgi:Flp pilus assembly protein TadD